MVIPALNEQESVGGVVTSARAIPGVVAVIVTDNGSVDHTAERAASAGAHVVPEPVRGYGRACLTALARAEQFAPDTILFMDADAADDPDDASSILQPIITGRADMVVGSRIAQAEPGALLPQARFGNWLATWMLDVFFHVKYSDLGPFRAIRWDVLQKLDMRDQDFGWTVEMQARAARMGFLGVEVPVNYRKRVGASKISGTLAGSLRAGQKILMTLVKERFFS